MSAKILSALSDNNGDLRKQIGGMNAYKFFYSNNFLGRPKAQGEQHRMEKQNPRIVNENDTALQNQIARETTRSSTYTSSVTCDRKLSETAIFPPRASTDMNEKQQTRSKSMQSSDIRDIVRESMYREARSLQIKFRNNEEKPATSLMKYIDSPRPLQRSALRKTELMVREGLTLAPADVYTPMKNSKDERLSLPRLSFDKQELVDNIKLKELPRLSLDSRETAMRNSRLSNQEHGTQKRLSSVVAKLMGLDSFPDSKSTPEIYSNTSKARQNKSTSLDFIVPGGKMRHELSISGHIPQRNSDASPRMHHGGNLSVTMEPAPWKEQNYGKTSPRIVPRSSKPLVTDLDQSFASCGEAKRRIEDGELRYGKDLRTLKQVLESLQRISRALEDENVDFSKLSQRDHRSEQACSDQKPNFSTWQNKTREQDATARRIRSHSFLPHQADRSTSLMNEKVSAQVRKHQKKNNHSECKTKNITPRGAWKSSVAELTSRTQSTTRRMNPRVQINLLKAPDDSPRSTLSMELVRDRNRSSKKSAEKSSTRRKKHSESPSFQSTYDQLSEVSSDTRCSSNQGDTASTKSDGNTCDASQMGTVETPFLTGAINTYSGVHPNCLKPLADCIPSVKQTTSIVEQPSPVSVLDNSFYNEDEPSPIPMISTALQELETNNPGRGWYTENPPHFEAGFQAESRFNSENPPRNTNRSAYISADPDNTYINGAKVVSEHSLTRRTPHDVLSSWLLHDSKELHTSESFNRSVIDTENEMLIRGELFTSRRKSTDLDTVTKESSTEIRSLGHETVKRLNAEEMHELEDWKEFGVEIPRLVLDIERQIFKDLINEVI